MPLLRGSSAAALCLLVATGLLPRYSATAGTQLRFTAPQGNRKIENGLRIAVESNWLDGSGYRPVDITLIPTAPGPAPLARTIRIELSPNHYWESRTPSFAVVRDVEIPEGHVGSVTARILVPQKESLDQFALRAFEGNRQLEDLAGSSGMNANSGQYGLFEVTPHILVVHDGAPPLNNRWQHIAALSRARRMSGGGQNTKPPSRLPDIHTLLGVLPLPLDFDETEPPDDGDLMRLVEATPNLEWVRPVDVPKQWIALASADLIFISRGALARLAADSTERYRAIARWTRAGGTLCVWGAGPRFEQLGQIEKQFQLAPLESPAGGDSIHAGWKTPRRTDYGRDKSNLLALKRMVEDNYGSYTMTVDEPEADPDATHPPIGPPPDVPPFVWRDCSFGTVVALGSEDPFPGTAAQWQWLFDSLGTGRWMWYRRHGVSFTRENTDYWNFLIPGVGFAPINAFRVLITVFVVLIGPVNYYLLRRFHRLHLLLVTVPGGAALACLGLFGYALAADGLGVRVRARSFTELDQRNGRAVSWSRQSYYAGLIPSRGLEFPETAAVYPIEATPQGYGGSSGHRRRLVWENGQNLRSGYMQSRVVTQMMVVHPQQTGARLKITPAVGDGSGPTVVNQLGTTVELLLLCDRDGNYFKGRDIAAKASCRLEPAELAPVQAELRAAVADHRPRPPQGFDPQSYRGGSWFFGRHYYAWSSSNRETPRPTVNSSLMEKRIAAIATATATELTPGSYVAIVQEPPTVAVAVPSAQREACFHVILGKW